ncbi:MAG: AAA family ATPase [Acidobacteria bacterium]|nr:AAA family ATPase [Acidobacteriota bacterium]
MPSESCPACGGSGWKIVERDEVSAAERCDCLSGARSRSLRAEASIPPRYAEASLKNFRARGMPADEQELKHTLVLLGRFIADFPALERPGLLLMGETGTGKTHLAVAVLRELIGRGFSGLFCDFQFLLNRIRSSYDESSGSPDRDLYRSALDTDILLLDDLGAQRGTEWAEDTVASIVTHRCNQKKALFATTNLPDPDAPDAFGRKMAGVATDYRRTLADQIGGRARSRLFEMCTVIRLPAIEDYRVAASRGSR